jgi:hypothetical protein
MSTDPKAGPSVARARVPLVAKERATPAQLAVWDRIAQSRGRVAGPFAALLHSPELARRIAETGHYVRFEGPLSQAETTKHQDQTAALHERAATLRASLATEQVRALDDRLLAEALAGGGAGVRYANGLLASIGSATRAFAALRSASGCKDWSTSPPPSATTR